MGVRDGARMKSCRHQSGDMGHVGHQERASFIGNLAETLKVDCTRIGAGTGHDQFRMVFQRKALHLVIIDRFRKSWRGFREKDGRRD